MDKIIRWAIPVLGVAAWVEILVVAYLFVNPDDFLRVLFGWIIVTGGCGILLLNDLGDSIRNASSPTRR
ncbi:MAG: hypothetical protein UY71_C0039G0003 [Parcubacteria group bacterium GW2011_GWB1_52_7]|nr:MAG: hypothetical protein UY64_C0026G0026 [Parcubacteria group bacterium GW2011_GWA1_51_12]KKW27698.1 MAG: hypothetical protein UY71_C0039G0003 [Parcubacteria group bacterium GW2011_GWB1_52_7]